MMKAHILKKLTYFAGNPLIDTFHYVGFHGLASRPETKRAVPAYWLGETLDHHLRVQLNGYRLNHVIQPAGNLVISEEVKECLSGFSNIEFFRVEFEKVFILPYREGDFSHWDDPSYFDDGEGPDKVVERQSHHPELAGEMLEFYELICPRHMDVKDQFAGLSEVDVAIGPTEYDERFRAALSDEMLLEYPILQQHGCLLMSEATFAQIEGYLNSVYFLQAEAQI